MGWSIGWDSNTQRWIGYGVPAYCDHPECDEEIDRGLSYVCGGQPYGGDKGCGLYFCEKHRHWNQDFDSEISDDDLAHVCERCLDPEAKNFKPKPEHPIWINHLLTDESWEQWRNENADEVDTLRTALSTAQGGSDGT